MMRMSLLACVALIVGAGCSSKGPYADVVVGKQFPKIDSLPMAMKKDDWKTLQWKNLDAKPLTKDGGSCTGHAGVLERIADHAHWLILGLACNGTALLTDSGARFEGHPLPTKNEKDSITMEARFAEMLEEGVYALWTSTKVLKDQEPESEMIRDEFVIRRSGTLTKKLLELTNEGVVGAELEGGFPKTFVVKTGLAEQRLVFKDVSQRYVHDSFKSNDFKNDAGVNSAERLYGDGGLLVDASSPNPMHIHHDP